MEEHLTLLGLDNFLSHVNLKLNVTYQIRSLAEDPPPYCATFVRHDAGDDELYTAASGNGWTVLQAIDSCMRDYQEWTSAHDGPMKPMVMPQLV